jgi:hypothetical protein
MFSGGKVSLIFYISPAEPEVFPVANHVGDSLWYKAQYLQRGHECRVFASLHA